MIRTNLEIRVLKNPKLQSSLGEAGRMDINDIGKEAYLHWNGPPTAKADRLRREALNRRLRRGRWHFITLDNKLDSVVTKRLKKKEPGLTFF